MVEYSAELMEKLKTDLNRNKLNFIPCTLNDDNVIVSYPLSKNMIWFYIAYIIV